MTSISLSLAGPMILFSFIVSRTLYFFVTADIKDEWDFYNLDHEKKKNKLLKKKEREREINLKKCPPLVKNIH